MPRFPYVNFPFQLYRTPHKTPPGFYDFTDTNINTNNHKNTNNPPINFTYHSEIPHTNLESRQKNNIHKDYEQKNKSNNNNANYLFDLFGLKIYNDDALLISLIYFLYSEGVKDDGLFLVLILLLLG